MAARILIVDPDRPAAQTTCAGLQALLAFPTDIVIIPAPDAALLDGPVPPDVCIIDPVPLYPVIVFLTRIQSAWPSLPVIVLTAYDTHVLRTRMRTLGVWAYLAKPILLPELLPVVEAALLRRSRTGTALLPARGGREAATRRIPMLPPRPSVILHADGTYYCADLRVLYYWLEAHGYPYFGTFADNEYGRFACQPLPAAGASVRHIRSYIQVLRTGAVVAADQQAQQVLDALLSARAVGT